MNDYRNQGLYPKETIASLLNISERRIEQLVKQKIIPKAGRGVFDLGPTVQAYVRYLQGLCSGAIHSGEPSELEKRLLEAKVLERESKARQAKYRADAMERSIQDRHIKTQIQKIPKKLSEKLSRGVLDAQSVEIVRREIEAVVSEILCGGDEA